MQIQIAAQYKDDDRVVLGFSKFGRGGVRANAKLGKGVNRKYVSNTAFTNFWVGGVLTNDMVIVN